MTSGYRWLFRGFLIPVLCCSILTGEALASNVVSIWFKTPGDKFETYADEATKGYDANGEVYYYYNPARTMDEWPVCADPNGLSVSYRYQNQDYSTYYELGGTLYLWHGRMMAYVGNSSYTTDDQGDLYISDLPDGTYIIQGFALLQGAYIKTVDGHLSWFTNAGQMFHDQVAYFNIMSYLGSPTRQYQAYTWYDLLSVEWYNGWHPYWNGFQIAGGYASFDLRISHIASQHVTRLY